MKKEETIEVIKKHAKFVSDNNYYYANEGDIEAIADELQTKEMSDEEIETYAKSCSGNLGNIIMDKAVEAGFIQGAKAYRDGKIKQL